MAKDKGRFKSEGWECPQCGLSMKDPKLGHKIIRLTVVHLDPPSEWPGVGLNVRACDHSKPIQVAETNGVPNPWHAGTGDAKQVSCPDCMLTDEYKKVLAASEDEDESKTELNPGARAAIERIASFVTER